MDLKQKKISNSTKKRRAITLEEKLKIVKRYENGEKVEYIAQALDMPRSTISTILKHKEKIKHYVNISVPMSARIVTKRRCNIFYELEKNLITWMKEYSKSTNVPLSHTQIKEKAKMLYTELREKRGETDKTFLASNGWFCRFKNRANLDKLFLNSDDNILLDEINIKEEYPNGFCQLVEDDEYSKDQEFDDCNNEDELKISSKDSNEELSNVLSVIQTALDRLKRLDHNEERFQVVNRTINAALSCYRELGLDQELNGVLASSVG